MKERIRLVIFVCQGWSCFKLVIPAKAGIQELAEWNGISLDDTIRRDDNSTGITTSEVRTDMHASDQELAHLIHWKSPLVIILKMFLAFSVLTFFVGYFIFHHPQNWLIPAIVLAISYLTCIIAGITYLIKKLPFPILLLLIPIAPLFVLIYVISLMTFLEHFT